MLVGGLIREWEAESMGFVVYTKLIKGISRRLIDGSESLIALPLISQGTSRGGANVKEIVRRIDLWGLNMVFVVGGNGGNAAAHAIAEECLAQVWGAHIVPLRSLSGRGDPRLN